MAQKYYTAMKRSHPKIKVMFVISTLAFSAVLTLSMPAAGQNPFHEIPVESWIYANLAELQAAGVLDTADLNMPQIGESLLRIEAALIINNVLRSLSAKAGIAVPDSISTLNSVVLSSFIAALFADKHPELVGNLFALVKEFQPELGILANTHSSAQDEARPLGTGMLGADSVTLKGPVADLVFVDIDAIPPADLSPQRKEGIVSPGQLSSLARHYFREIRLVEPTQQPVMQLPREIELYAPLQIERPQITLGQHQSDAQLLATAGLSGWQRYRPTLFSREGLLTEEPSTLYFLGVEAKVLSGLTLGSLWIADQKLQSGFGFPEDEGRIYRTVSGQLRLRPGFTLIGEYSQSGFNDSGDDQPSAKPDDVAARIGAIFHWGEVEVGADLRSTGQNYSPLFEKNDFTPNSSGYGLSLKYRNLTVETIRDRLQPSTEEESAKRRTTLQLNYSFAERAMFKAGYSFVDVDSVDPTQPESAEKGESATFGVGVSLNENTKIEADLTFGWQTNEKSVALFDTKKASAGIQWRLPWEVDLKVKADYEFSEETSKNLTTTVGLNYDFRENASLLLGYQLINFSSETEEGVARAGAELSISF